MKRQDDEDRELAADKAKKEPGGESEKKDREYLGEITLETDSKQRMFLDELLEETKKRFSKADTEEIKIFSKWDENDSYRPESIAIGEPGEVDGLPHSYLAAGRGFYSIEDSNKYKSIVWDLQQGYHLSFPKLQEAIKKEFTDTAPKDLEFIVNKGHEEIFFELRKWK